MKGKLGSVSACWWRSIWILVENIFDLCCNTRPAVVSSSQSHRGREGFSSLLEGESGVEATLLYVYSTDFFTWTPEGRSY